MKYLIRQTDKYKGKIWFSLLLNVVVFLLLMLIMTPVFETNDDISISMIVSGAYGEASPVSMCQHYFLGVFYNFLYHVFGNGVPWYALVQHIVLILSFTAITYIILNRFASVHALWITGILLVYFGYGCYVTMQYTKTAAAATAASAFLLFYSVTKEKISLKGILGAFALGITGFLYRDKEFAMVFALMSGIGLFLILDIKAFPKCERIRRAVTGITAYVLIAAAGIGLYAVNLYTYTSDPEWAYYMKYNDLRSAVMDYGVPDYEENEEAMQELGISENSYKMYRGWNFNDPEKMTVDTWQGILDLQPEKPALTEAFADYLKQFPASFFQLSIFGAACLFMVIWLFWGKHDHRTVLTALYEFLIVMLGYFFLYYSGRYLMNRVDTGIWLAVSLVFIWLLGHSGMKLSGRAGIVVFLGVLILKQGVQSESWRINMEKQIRENHKEQEVFEKIAGDKEHLYLAVNGEMTNGCFAPYDSIEKGYEENIVWLGGWETNMVTTNRRLHNYGITNPFRDAVDHDAVYVIGKSVTRIEKYIQEHYAPDAEAKKVDEINDFTIYRFSTKKDSTKKED